MKIRNKTILFIFMISLLISIIAFPSLKEQIPIHWGFDGKIDGYGSRYWIFLEPALILIFRFFMDFVRKIDPKKNSYHIFHREYDLFMTAIAPGHTNSFSWSSFWHTTSHWETCYIYRWNSSFLYWKFASKIKTELFYGN